MRGRRQALQAPGPQPGDRPWCEPSHLHVYHNTSAIASCCGSGEYALHVLLYPRQLRASAFLRLHLRARACCWVSGAACRRAAFGTCDFHPGPAASMCTCWAASAEIGRGASLNLLTRGAVRASSVQRCPARMYDHARKAYMARWGTQLLIGCIDLERTPTSLAGARSTAR
jgi:hypothetical protein